MISAKEMETKERESIERGLQSFFRSPLVSTMLAQIPTHPNLTALIEAAYKAGHCSGQSLILAEMLTQMQKGHR